jgi:hypothetical protein
MGKKLLYFILLFATSMKAQNYQVRLMSWNVLNWPNNSSTVSDTSNRCPSYRAIMNYAQPDILITCENTSTNSIPWFRDQVMNTGIYHYASGLFINGPDTDNGIYFRDSLFDFVSNIPVHTSLRDISQFVLVFKPTGDTLRIFSCHLKASVGYESQRAGEVADLRQVTNAFPPGTNFLIGGDFNVYNSTEPAYVGLLQDNPNDDGNFNDVLNMQGIWNSANYAPYHTQSTHISSTGGFSGGGLDDRFDMILFSNGVLQPGGGVYYVQGTYHNIGNDGNHYQDNINYGTNTSVPAGIDDALFNTSDHLPVMLTLMIGPTAGIDEQEFVSGSVDVFPNPAGANSVARFNLKKPAEMSFFLTDNLGRIVSERRPVKLEQGLQTIDLNEIQGLENGYYLLSLKLDNTLINKQLIVIK